MSGIASVTREKHFSADLIKPSTQVVFIDEWTSDSLCAEDPKKVLQGGLQILPQKNKEASKCVDKSSFYITTNEMPQLGSFSNRSPPYSKALNHEVATQELHASFPLLC